RVTAIDRSKVHTTPRLVERCWPLSLLDNIELRHGIHAQKVMEVELSSEASTSANVAVEAKTFVKQSLNIFNEALKALRIIAQRQVLNVVVIRLCPNADHESWDVVDAANDFRRPFQLLDNLTINSLGTY